MRINGATYGKLKTPLKVNGNLDTVNRKHVNVHFKLAATLADKKEVYIITSSNHRLKKCVRVLVGWDSNF